MHKNYRRAVVFAVVINQGPKLQRPNHASVGHFRRHGVPFFFVSTLQGDLGSCYKRYSIAVSRLYNK